MDNRTNAGLAGLGALVAAVGFIVAIYNASTGFDLINAFISVCVIAFGLYVLKIA